MIDWDAAVHAPIEAVFGEDLPPRYWPASGGGPLSVSGIFDEAYVSVQILGDGQESHTTRPALGVRDAQFAVPPGKNDKVYIPRVDKLYIVRDLKPDGHGFTLLLLGLSTEGLPANV